jgi:hypothetical protein
VRNLELAYADAKHGPRYNARITAAFRDAAWGTAIIDCGATWDEASGKCNLSHARWPRRFAEAAVLAVGDQLAPGTPRLALEQAVIPRRGPEPNRGRLEKVRAEIERNPGITDTQLGRLLGVSRQTAHNDRVRLGLERPKPAR